MKPEDKKWKNMETKNFTFYPLQGIPVVLKYTVGTVYFRVKLYLSERGLDQEKNLIIR